MRNPWRVALCVALVLAVLVPAFVGHCGSPFDNRCGSAASAIAIYLTMPMFAVPYLANWDPRPLMPLFIPLLALVTFVWVVLVTYAFLRLANFIRAKHIDA